MSNSVTRPRGVLVAAILLIVAGVFHIVTGVMAIVSVSAEQDPRVGPAIALLGGTILIGLLDIVLAIGILRGSRIARLLATILQAMTVALGLIGLASAEAAQDISKYAFTAIVTPLAIILMLWIGAQTRDFFARKN